MDKIIRLQNQPVSKMFLNCFNNKRYFLYKNEKSVCNYFSIPANIYIFFKKNFIFFLLKDLNDKNTSIYINNFSSWINSIDKKIKQKLILKGLGFRSYFSDDKTKLMFKLGYSHIISLDIPKTVYSITIEKNVLILEGFNLIKLGTFSKKIKNLKKIDVYKNKGFSYPKEFIKKKQIKKS
jgi:large subunit ribosomal protein L6